MITPYTKEKTEALEHTTIPIENKLVPLSEHVNRISALSGWYRRHSFDASTPQETRNAKLSELLGFNPQYHGVRGSDGYDNAIWGFDYRGNGCVLYNSQKGLTLQVVPEIEKDSAVNLMDSLIERFN